MSRFPSWGFALALAPLVACTNQPLPISATAPVVPPSPVLSAQDQAFLNIVDASDQFEISSSQLVPDKTRNPGVRRFAQRMVTDHSKTTQQLLAIAHTKGTDPQPLLTPPQRSMLSELQSESGRTFDRELPQ